MQIIVSSATLLKNLSIVGGVIGSNTVLPILEDFLFEIKGEDLKITGSDLEARIMVSVPVQNNESNDEIIKLCLPSKIVLEYLKNLPEQPLTLSFEAEQNVVEITSSTGKYKITGQPANEYPKAPERGGAHSFHIAGSRLLDAVNHSIFATSTDTLRPAMTGVCIDFKGDNIVFVATDAHRLVKKEVKVAEAPEEGTIIVPRKPLNQLKNIIPVEDAPVQISYNETHLYIEFESVLLSARLIDAKFPDYTTVIPSQNPFKLSVEKNELSLCLRRVSVFASKGTSQVVFDIKGNMMEIQAQDVDFSYEGKETLPCQYDGEDMKIAFNARLLIEMLNNLEGEKVIVELNTPSRAAIFKPEENNEDEDLLMLLMPLIVGL